MTLEPKKQNNMYRVTSTKGSNALSLANFIEESGTKSFSYWVVAKEDILYNILANSSGLSKISIAVKSHETKMKMNTKWKRY